VTQNILNDLQALFDLDISSCGTNVCLASFDNNQRTIQFQRLQIMARLAKDFSEIVQAAILRLKKAKSNGNLKLQPYDSSVKMESHEIEYLDLNVHNSIKDQIASLSSLSSVPDFKQEEDFISGLRFYVVIITPSQGEPILLFRNFTPKKELTNKKTLAVWMGNDKFDRFTEKLYLFDMEFDCFSFGQTMYILKKSNFHKIFRFFEEILKTAEQTLNKISGLNLVDNFDVFCQSCRGHIFKMTKLHNIARKPYLQKLTMSSLQQTVKDFGLNVKFNNNKLLFDSSDGWELLRLFDDDYLKSDMTKTKYEVNSKRTR
jgi:hypothetical protein